MCPVLREMPELKDKKAEEYPQYYFVQGCLEALINTVKDQDGLRLPPYPLTYWALRSLHAWGIQVEKEAYVRRCLEWSRSEFYRQISLFVAGDEESDAYQLGYNLLIQSRFGRKYIHNSVLSLGVKLLFEAQLARGVGKRKIPSFSMVRRATLIASLSSFYLRSSTRHAPIFVRSSPMKLISNVLSIGPKKI